MPDTILTDELINRLHPFVSYSEFNGKDEGARGILHRYLVPDATASPEYIDVQQKHDIGIKRYSTNGDNVLVTRHVLNPELGVRHSLDVAYPFDRVGARGGWSHIGLENLTSDEAKRIIRVLRDNPELREAMLDVPFNRKPIVDNLGNLKGTSYHFIEDPSDNLRNWLSELWDKQKKVPEDKIQFSLYPALKWHHKNVQEELFDALNKRVHKSNALMTAGMGLAGALAGDEDSKIKTSILGALGAGLGTYGSTFAHQLASSDKLQNKLYRMLVKRPWLRMGAGALGGLAGILAGKGTSGSDEGSVIDELADKVEDLTGADVKGSDMLKYILLGGGGLAALGGLGYAATRKKKKKSEEKRDA
jgi:hypothetical protein